MSEEQTVKLYSAAFIASRDEEGHRIVRIKPGVVLALSIEEAYREGMGGAFASLPEADGWGDHQVILTELPSDLTLGHYHVSWTASKIF